MPCAACPPMDEPKNKLLGRGTLIVLAVVVGFVFRKQIRRLFR